MRRSKMYFRNDFCIVIVSLLIKNSYNVKADLIDIIGGAPADIRQFPYQVSLRFNNRFGCGGTIIDNRHILTAAHCVCSDDYTNCPVSTNGFTIAAGSSTLHPMNGVQIPVKQVFVYENYVSNKIYVNDIAVLRLSKPLTFNDKIQYYPLADDTPRAGTQCVASGWGMTSGVGGPSNNLMHINISIISHNSCASTVNIFYKVVCAERGRKTPWLGDSGGPLICGGKVAGIVNLAHTSHLIPSIYTDVAKYRNWIAVQMKRDTSVTVKLNFLYYIYALTFTIVYSYIRRIIFISTAPFNAIFIIIQRIFHWLF